MTATKTPAALEAALDYLRRGWTPIPCCPPGCDAERVPWHWKDEPCKKPGKIPLLKWTKWQKRRPQESDLKSWWARWPWANVGLVTGEQSDIVVVDLEVDASLNGYPVPPTVIAQSGSGGRHYYFRHPGRPVETKTRILGPEPAVDVRGDGGFIVVAPSGHSSGERYDWILGPEDEELAELPDWVLEALKRKEKGENRRGWEQVAQGVPEGQRNETAASYAGKLLSQLTPELWESAAWPALVAWNERNTPPLEKTELRGIFESIREREAAKQKQRRGYPQRSHPPATWEEVEAKFAHWLELPDMDAVRVVLATVVANRLHGDPVWLFLVAPPSSAKTEIIQSLSDLDDVYRLTMLTPNTFLSGKKPEDKKGEISLLPKLNGKILAMKDFAPILDLHRDARQAIFSQLRDIYDGSTAKAVGNEQRTMRWEGKMGFIAGVTQVLDSYSSLLSLLGERFLQFRLPAAGESDVMRRALTNAGKERRMREELRAVVAGFLQTVLVEDADVELPNEVYGKLEALVKIVIRARTGVIRDSSGSREIIYTPDHEGPARLAKQLAMLLTALAQLRGSAKIGAEDYRLAYKCGMDSIHRMRRLIIEALAGAGEPLKSHEVANEVSLSTPAARKYLEDLQAVKLLDREKAGNYDTAPDVWSFKPEIRRWWEVAKP